MAARKKTTRRKQRDGKRVYLVGRSFPFRAVVDGEIVNTPQKVGNKFDVDLVNANGLRRLIRSGYVVCLIDGVPIRQSRRWIGRLRGHKAMKKGTRLASVAAKVARGAAGGRLSSSTLPGGGEGEKGKAAGASTGTKKKATKKKATKKKATKKKATKKKAGKKKAGKKKS